MKQSNDNITEIYNNSLNMKGIDRLMYIHKSIDSICKNNRIFDAVKFMKLFENSDAETLRTIVDVTKDYIDYFIMKSTKILITNIEQQIGEIY